MKKNLVIFGSTFLALLTLAPLSVSAQSGRQFLTVCYQPSTGRTYTTTAADCAAPGQPDAITNNIPAGSKFYGICYKDNAGTILYSANILGRYECPDKTVQPKLCPNYSGINVSQWCLAGPAPVPPNPVPGNTNSPPINGGGGGGGGGGGTVQPSTPCDPPEPGFHKVGGLCIPESPFSNSNGIANASSVGNLAARIIRVLLYLAGIVAVIMIIIGGYQYMTAAGNDVRAANGRKTLVNALIGLVIIILAYVIVQAVINFVT